LVAKVVDTLQMRRVVLILTLAVLSLLVSYAIVEVSPDRATVGRQAAPDAAPTAPAH